MIMSNDCELCLNLYYMANSSCLNRTKFDIKVLIVFSTYTPLHKSDWHYLEMFMGYLIIIIVMCNFNFKSHPRLKESRALHKVGKMHGNAISFFLPDCWSCTHIHFMYNYIN